MPNKRYKINTKTAIVTTTVNIPTFLEKYIQSFKCYSNIEKLAFIIIGDLKSPHEKIVNYLKKLNTDITIEYWDIKLQKEWIQKTFNSELVEQVNFAIPYNSIRRRNLGYLIALEWGAEVIISIDDDNYPTNSSWLYEHLSILNCVDTLPTVSSRNKVVNPCHILKFNYPDVHIYSRGYPFSELFLDTFDVHVEGGKRTALNIGLWIGSPDVDAYTNISYPNLKSLGIKEDHNDRYALAQDNYMPVNTQNTAFIRELTPAFYDVLMDTRIHGMRIDRYDDIWAGLFALKLIHSLNYRVTFGIPLSDHRRNIHDLIADFKSELLGMSLNNKLFKIIMELDIQAKDFISGYLELADALQVNVIRHFTDNEVLKYFLKVIKAMRIWIRLVEGVI